MYNILVIGAVQTTAVTLQRLIQHQFKVVGVMGHEPLNVDRVSGWVDLKAKALEYDLDYFGFKKINDISAVEWAIERKPDIIFAVGFSQLMADAWLKMPTLGCIGFHPTKLPEGRGRAPLAWITLEQKTGSATFFLMGKGADDGPVFVQSLFDIIEEDDANSVEEKIKIHIEAALDEWLPNLKKGLWEPIPQEELLASWYGKRGIEDGCIEWTNSSNYNNRLIKASTKPHPGAYTYFKNQKVIIWKSEKENNLPIKGVTGRVLLIDDKDRYLIQCGEGLLWIYDLEFESEEMPLNVGDKLGYAVQDEIYQMKKKI